MNHLKQPRRVVVRGVLAMRSRLEIVMLVAENPIPRDGCSIRAGSLGMVALYQQHIDQPSPA